MFFGLFGEKKKEPVKTKTQTWLEDADEAYEFACRRRLTSGLALFFNGSALKYLMNKITHLREDSSGIEAYRNTKFKKIKTSDGSKKYKRIVTYDDIQLSKYVKVPLGEPYTEKWTLDDKNDLAVSNIERIDE